MAQFRGRKLVKLVAPFESAHLYNHEHRYSRVDLDAVDLARFPEMADVTIFEVVIGPGEMLFVPAGWWHTVRALDVSITITFPNFVWETTTTRTTRPTGPSGDGRRLTSCRHAFGRADALHMAD